MYYIAKDNDDEELRHYGVIGMRWGVRHKKKYKTAKIKAKQSRNKSLSKTVDRSERKRIKKKYKKALEDARVEVAQRYSSKTNKDVVEQIVRQSTGKTIAKELIFGNYGSVVYQDIKHRTNDRVAATGASVAFGILNRATSNMYPVVRTISDEVAGRRADKLDKVNSKYKAAKRQAKQLN